jgi:hypothetical protein
VTRSAVQGGFNFGLVLPETAKWGLAFGEDVDREGGAPTGFSRPRTPHAGIPPE